METIVLALGGNALIRPGEEGSYDEQERNVRGVAKNIAKLSMKYRIVVTHGNGPQVGHTVLRHEAASSQVPAFPLDAAVAETQGFIGYLIQKALHDTLNSLGKTPVSVITQVSVNGRDPAFRHPTKPIGPFYPPSKVEALKSTRPELKLSDDLGRGVRRLVPSPQPEEILEADVIRLLASSGHVVVCCGGGGIPVVRRGSRVTEGVEAVIDKDLTSMRLASAVAANRLVMLTDVEGAYLNYAQPDAKLLEEVTVREAIRYLKMGHFKEGSMGPKVQAAIEFLRNGGTLGVIAHLDRLVEAADGSKGTRIRRSTRKTR